MALPHPEMMISSSTPYSFMCCSPQPSLMRLGMYFFRSPVRFGVWYIRISTLSAPNSDTSGASNEAQDASGDSLVPLKASVNILSFTSGFARRACCSVEICTHEQKDEAANVEERNLRVHFLFFLCTK